ncbi:PHP domain-containing protein [[Eubacterium] cellulosolvens]
MMFDLHTHTDGYSPCSRISLEQLILAETRLVDGIAITDHDHLMRDGEAEALTKKYGLLVMPGIEISADGIYAHILAFGINKEVRPDLGVEETIFKIHEQKGVAIAAHPYRYVNNLDRKEWENLDAIETLTPNCALEQNKRAQETALEWGLPQIGSSDAHNLSMVGRYATRFPNQIHTIDELKRCLILGSMEPVTLTGIYGKF